MTNNYAEALWTLCNKIRGLVGYYNFYSRAIKLLFIKYLLTYSDQLDINDIQSYKTIAEFKRKYDEAKNAQAANEAKIAELEEKIKYARIIDESEIDTEVVQVGNIVKVRDLEFDEDIEYTIVGSTEVDTANNKISNESPIGKALLGKKKNNVVEVQAPVGIIKLKILSIKK